MRQSRANCIYCGAQAYWDPLADPLSPTKDYCPTQGCPAYHPHAYVAEEARKTLIQFGGGYATPIVPTEKPLYETTAVEKVEAGITIQHAQSVQEAWDRLEKKGYTLARRTKPEQPK